MDFKIEDAGKPAEIKRGGGKMEVYPFSQLKVNQSFFVADKTAEKFQSTLRYANQRYAEQTKKTKNYGKRTVAVYKQLRQFVVRNVVKGQKNNNGYIEKQNGIRVYRIK